MEKRLQQLIDKRARLLAGRVAITDLVLAEGRDSLTGDETKRFQDLSAEIEDLTVRIAQLGDEIERSGRTNPICAFIRGAHFSGTSWAARAADALLKLGGEARAIASDSVDVPTLVESEVSAKERPSRLIDLFTNRKAIEGNAFEYYRQTVRTNNATAVADGGTKPTSVFSLELVDDRARVIAHLSEPMPIRLFQDHPELNRWLDTEMAEGVLDALEAQVIAGDGEGENLTGLLSTTGTTSVAFDTDLPTTMRSAVTALQLIGAQPNGWVLNPADAQTINLLRFQWGGTEAADAGFLLDGYQNTNAGSGNVFGPTTPRVVSNSVPEGTAILGDWGQLRLYVREGVRLDVDAGGDLFTTNQAIVRAEGRFGIGVLKPLSFAIVDLTA
ncbi:phage major capsid protein [Mycolicibacterium thermoresistibile]|nr:phage major capsid protein [Mycolicibacterium thermoresistibile]MCV7190844.1 phage major capsid protein [Mycolicibacterium thermoresistibile]GAT17620.1 putative uncharacterized protein [Mycolicibacterium thermoresistibile]SNW18700.1 HK97 family phage prohead protease [Mycolicibacterium thermoresistibile]